MIFLSSNERKEIIKELLFLMKKNSFEITSVLTNELNRAPIETHISEIVVVKEELKYFIKNVKKLCRAKRVPTPFQLLPGKSYIKYEPFGTVVVISPWNFPFHLSLVPAVGALAAGNKVLIKTSPKAPLSSLLLKDIINNQLDSEWIRVVEGDDTTARDLIEKEADFVFFTGSEKSGHEVYKLAAEKFIPVIMELGGQNPLIFHADGSIKTMNRLVWGKLLNAGQTCLSPNHAFVHHSVKEEFIKSFKNTVHEFYGNALFSNEDYPKIIDSKDFNKLNTLIEKNKNAIIVGGKSNAEKLKIEPTLIEVNSTDAKSSELLNNEIFGPILPVIFYSEMDEVIKQINYNKPPLCIYIFSSDKKLISKIEEETTSGAICVNDCLVQGSNPNFPFGGVQNSGIGKYHGIHSFNTFSNPKNVLIRSKKISLIPRFPPFNKKIFKVYDYL